MRYLRFLAGSLMTSLALTTLLACSEPVAPVTPPAPTDTRRTTVSGLSAGGYMAVQAHIALSDRIVGAAALAGGPYNIAEGSIKKALSTGMQGGDIDIAALADTVRSRATAGGIGTLANLDQARVWLFHSPADAVIAAQVSAASEALYRAIAPTADIVLVNDVEAAHGWPTLETGRACTDQGGDFINACGYDAAGALLKHLYGDLAAPATQTAPLRTIDLSELVPDNASIANSAPAFVPDHCASDPTDCRLHVAFHGCRQSTQFIEQRYAKGIGLNRWAATNNIVVVYPQVEKSMMNPQGCWDWWGYTGANYDQRTGPQIAAVAAIIDRFEKGELF